MLPCAICPAAEALPCDVRSPLIALVLFAPAAAQPPRVLDVLAGLHTALQLADNARANHDQRLADVEAAIAAARDLLGDVSGRGDMATQISVLAQQILSILLAHFLLLA